MVGGRKKPLFSQHPLLGRQTVLAGWGRRAPGEPLSSQAEVTEIPCWPPWCDKESCHRFPHSALRRQACVWGGVPTCESPAHTQLGGPGLQAGGEGVRRTVSSTLIPMASADPRCQWHLF